MDDGVLVLSGRRIHQIGHLRFRHAMVDVKESLRLQHGVEREQNACLGRALPRGAVGRTFTRATEARECRNWNRGYTALSRRFETMADRLEKGILQQTSDDLPRAGLRRGGAARDVDFCADFPMTVLENGLCAAHEGLIELMQ